MLSLRFWLCLSTFACSSLLSAAPLELHVSPMGNDTQNGSFEAPFATPSAAVKAIEKLKAESNLPAEGVTVTLQEGSYELEAPLEIKDYTTGEHQTILFQGAPGKTVRLLGSRLIPEFRQVTDPDQLKRLDRSAHGNVMVANLKELSLDDLGTVAQAGNRLELFYRHIPMQLARWPNEGFVKIKQVVGDTTFKSHGIPGTKEGWFIYDDDRTDSWANTTDVWLHGYWFWDWSDSFEKVESIDPDSNTIRLSEPYHNYGYRNEQRYYALNILSELDQPGEWYLDRETHQLYFWPMGEIEPGDVMISVLPSLINIENSKHIQFRNLTFEGTRSTLVNIRNSYDCTVDHCRLLNSGSWGVQIRDGKSCEVRHCEIMNLGEGGITLLGGDRQTLSPAKHLAFSNHIHHFGRLYRTYRPGVSVQGVGNHVIHNLIHDGPHNAIQLGGNDHLIEFNEVHHVCYETGDVGAFYMGRDWTARGTVIRHNFFHNISGPGLHGAMSVYLDDAASGIKIQSNLFLRAGRAAFIGGGRDNLVENNIFVDCNPSVHVDSRGIGWMHETVDTTLPERLNAMPYQESPWKERYPQLLTILEDEPGKPKYNFIRKNISVGGHWSHIDDKAELLVTLENNLIDEDPLFQGNPQSDSVTAKDFELKANSPAFNLGFEPIPVDEIGLVK
ncbi:hypothetical protein Pla110_16030 [Polystyrenella longa]|uniref:Right handed beta helix domain-containing protein n=1 Tax=Polystyrenella longa TaxID=2528007 RepID=A0A518CKY1_9PLAN|nr:right-handed parallel beta-helix repeat-containing protein [Polystyrenella longa]QDU79883.1 hypothetical protein Pla110_16030 [Polystyrenella longa]